MTSLSFEEIFRKQMVVSHFQVYKANPTPWQLAFFETGGCYTGLGAGEFTFACPICWSNATAQGPSDCQDVEGFAYNAGFNLINAGPFSCINYIKPY